jgi:phage head maturation protease
MEIKELIAKKAELIALKKAEIKTVKGGLSALVQGSVSKGIYENSDTSLKRTIIGNTYNWMDSHDDVHAKGVFTKSIKERANQIFHLHDHEFKLTSKVGEPLKVYEDVVKWVDLGVQKDGTTQALFLDSEILKEYNERIFNEYKNGKINQHSVGMQYVKIDLAVNDEDYEEEYKVWQDNIDSLGNKEVAESKGYFWFVREAKLIEISAVLMGSNSLTPTINEPSKDTQKQEPSDNDTQKAIELFCKTILKNN